MVWYKIFLYAGKNDYREEYVFKQCYLSGDEKQDLFEDTFENWNMENGGVVEILRPPQAYVKKQITQCYRTISRMQSKLKLWKEHLLQKCEIKWCLRKTIAKNLVSVNDNIGDESYASYICPRCAKVLGMKDGDDLPHWTKVKKLIMKDNKGKLPRGFRDD